MSNPYGVTDAQVGAFNDAVASGNYGAAAAMAAAAGVPASVVADYVNANLGGLNLSAPVSAAGIGAMDVGGASYSSAVGSGSLSPSALASIAQTSPATLRSLEDQAVRSFINQYQLDPNVPIPFALYAGAAYTNPLITPEAVSRVTGADPGFVREQQAALNQIQPYGYSDAQLAVWLLSNNKGPNESQADFEKRLFDAAVAAGVPPEAVARVTGADPGYVQQRFEELSEIIPRRRENPITFAPLEPTPTTPGTPTTPAQQGLRSIPQTAILRSPMAMPDLVAQPETRPQLSSGIRALDLGTQTFGDLTNLQRGAPVAADRFPSTAIAGQVNPLRSYIDSLYAAGADDATVAAFGERAGLDPRSFAELFRDVPGTTPGTIQSFYNQLRPEGIYSTVTPNALQSQVNVPTRSFAPPMGDEAIVFRNLPEDQQIAEIRRYYQANPTVSPEQLVTDMTRFGVTTDLLRKAGYPATGSLAVQNVATPAGGTTSTGLLNNVVNSVVSGGGDSVGPTGATSTSGMTPGQAVDAATSVAAAVANALGISPGLDAFGAPVSDAMGSDGGAGASGAATGDSGGVTSGEGIRAGGLIRYQEGGMAKLSAREAGSQFDISEYIDPETGRFLVHEYQRDVLFNPELREAERVARERMTPEEEAYEIERMRARFGLPGYERPVRRASGGIIDVIPSKVYSARVPIQLGNPKFAQGGLASLAENLADKGRGGDSMLVHMSPEEVQGLRGLAMQMGGDLSVNPQTGLPEAKLLKKLLPILPFIPGIGQILGPIAAQMGSVGTALSSFASASPLLAKSIASGIIGGFSAPGKGFNFKQGLKTGLGAYAGGKLFETLSAMGTPGGSGVSPSGGGGQTLKVDPSLGGVPTTGSELLTADYVSGQPTMNAPSLQAPPSISEGARLGSGPTGIKLSPSATAPVTPDFTSQVSLTGAPKSVDYALTGPPSSSAAYPSTATGGERKILGMTPGEISTGIIAGSALMADSERQSQKQALAALNKEEEDRLQRFYRIYAQPYGLASAAGGGLVAMAGGGMPTFEYGGTTAPTGEPRMVKGAGDGMSDNVPANIEGVQEARLANDEFVVPADVVADIGNGSSSAGAKKLYAMMDRIRKARHGTTEQPPEIDAERLLPA
jgi:hypothetical protein